ncbi:MAG: hypothetical protein SOT07_04970 [Paludibacteraceae bacterium]|nr:hypothetical protein [Paludibacteraceae bacterium]
MMRKIFFFLVGLLVGVGAFAQGIVLEHTFTDEQVTLSGCSLVFQNDNVLFLAFDKDAGNVRIYDKNYNVVSSFAPQIPSDYEMSYAYSPLKGIYYADDAYYVLIFSTNHDAYSDGQYNAAWHMGLYDLTGKEVYDFGTGYTVSSGGLFVVDNQYKLLVWLFDYNANSYTSKVYRLGGQYGGASAVSQPTSAGNVVKYIQNGQVLVDKKNRTYNMKGSRVK